jgi:HicB family
MPRSLHGALAELAEREGTSLNQFITGTLASAIGWSGDGKVRPPGQPAQPAPSRTLVLVLIANAVAVGLAALGALAILLLAWLG